MALPVLVNLTAIGENLLSRPMPKAKDITNSLSALPKDSVGSTARVKSGVAPLPACRPLAFDPVSFISWFLIGGILLSQVIVIIWLVFYV